MLSGTGVWSGELRYGDPPKWARSGDVGATLRDGVPVAVEILVDGGPALRQALVARYGPPLRTTPVAFTTDSGVRWTANELEWLLPDVHVQFSLVRYGQAQGETEMNDYALLEPASADKPGKVKKTKTYKLTPGVAHVYNEGDLHSPKRVSSTKLIRIEGVNMEKVKRFKFELVS